MGIRQYRSMFILMMFFLFGENIMQAVERDNDSVKIVRPVVASTYFSVGNNQVYDTYLSINRFFNYSESSRKRHDDYRYV